MRPYMHITWYIGCMWKQPGGMERLQKCRFFASDTASTHYIQILNQIFKNKSRTILWKKKKNKYDPKIEMVKYLELVDQKKVDSF